MNNKSTLSTTQHTHQHHYNSLPLNEQQTSSGNATPLHTPTQIITPISGQQNGQLKRLDPVKLIVDEMPYVDNEQENE